MALLSGPVANKLDKWLKSMGTLLGSRVLKPLCVILNFTPLAVDQAGARARAKCSRKI